MIEYVKVKHDEECYICHSRENVKTLRVAADGSNGANTIAFCDKCAGAVKGRWTVKLYAHIAERLSVLTMISAIFMMIPSTANFAANG